jgi:hypothetical protein
MDLDETGPGMWKIKQFLKLKDRSRQSQKVAAQ